MKESIYIFYRKIKAFINSLCFYVCRIFPIDDKLISVCTFEGKGGFGCNPKYIVRELHKRDPGLRFVWFVNDMEKEFPEYVRKVPNTIWSRAYWLGKSKVWIDNYRKPYGTVKRKGQYYINVNHYTLAIKCTGLLRGAGFSKMAYLVSKNDSDMMDGLVIDSVWCEKCFDRAMVYDGEMMKTGAPRCDALYGDRVEYRSKFREKHNIEADAKVVMYAPTFREGAKNGKRSVFSAEYTIDFQRLIKNLEIRFGGKWYICFRVHPQLANSYKNQVEMSEDRLIDESLADDMYEVLAAMDAYITDYSSAIFEAGMAGIPAFMYSDDLDSYRNARGDLLWDFGREKRETITNNKELLPDLNIVYPFSLAEDNKQLEDIILSFNEDDYHNRIEDLINGAGVVFDGRASERLADIIMGRYIKN